MKRLGLLLGATTLMSACATTPPPVPMQTCPDGTQIPTTQPCPLPPPPPPTVCPNGSTVPAGTACPLPPPPPPPMAPPPPGRSGERG